MPLNKRHHRFDTDQTDRESKCSKLSVVILPAPVARVGVSLVFRLTWCETKISTETTTTKVQDKTAAKKNETEAPTATCFQAVSETCVTYTGTDEIHIGLRAQRPCYSARSPRMKMELLRSGSVGRRQLPRPHSMHSGRSKSTESRRRHCSTLSVGWQEVGPDTPHKAPEP